MGLDEKEEKELDELVANLAEAVSRALSNSNTVDSVINRIKCKGFSIELALVAHMSVSEGNGVRSLVKDAKLLDSKVPLLRFEFNSRDVEFLKSLHISAADDENY